MAMSKLRHHGGWLDAAARDVHYGLRQLRRNPGFPQLRDDCRVFYVA